MKVTIVHDDKGRILSVTKSVDLKRAGSKFSSVGVLPRANQRVIEVELDRELEHMSSIELHRNFEVEIPAPRLARKRHAP